MQELSSAGAVLANLLTGLGIDEFFTRTNSAGTRTFLGDAPGSTLALADNAGTLQTTYTYEPFGASTATGQTNTNTYQFTGRENDGTGLDYYRARYYSPSRQRFIAEDPIGIAGGDANLYAYVANDPVNRTDPLGLRIEWGNQLLSNPYVILNIYRLNRAVIAQGLSDSSFVLRVSGGDRYIGCAGEIRSATNDRTVSNTDSTTPHLWDNGARAVDLVATGVTNRVLGVALQSTDFDPAYTQRYRNDQHTHVSLPPGKRYSVDPDSIPPLGGRYGLRSCGPLF